MAIARESSDLEAGARSGDGPRLAGYQLKSFSTCCAPTNFSIFHLCEDRRACRAPSGQILAGVPQTLMMNSHRLLQRETKMDVEEYMASMSTILLFLFVWFGCHVWRNTEKLKEKTWKIIVDTWQCHAAKQLHVSAPHWTTTFKWS